MRRFYEKNCQICLQQIQTDAKMSLLLVEQNALAALSIANYGYIMENGKVVLDGESAKLMDNKDVKELEGRLRVKSLSSSQSKIGVFVKQFKLSSDFLNLIGKNAAELILRTKITGLLQNLKKYCSSNNLKELI